MEDSGLEGKELEVSHLDLSELEPNPLKQQFLELSGLEVPEQSIEPGALWPVPVQPGISKSSTLANRSREQAWQSVVQHCWHSRLLARWVGL